MSDDKSQEVLLELRRLRRLLQVFVIAGVLLLAFSVAMSASRKLSGQKDSWTAVRTAIDRGEYEKASAIAVRMIQKWPNDNYGYSYLGDIALAQGDLRRAETNYDRAYALLPNDENEKTLGAVRLRIKKETGGLSDNSSR